MIIERGRRWFSLKEAAAIAGVAEKDVRNELARRIIVPSREPRGEHTTLRFDARAAFCFYVSRHSPLPIPMPDRAALYRLLRSRAVADGPWKRVRNGVCHSGTLTLWLDTIFSRFRGELRAYRRGLRRIESNPRILGGEPVFGGTRISVRHVGLLAARGVSVEEILADFPALSPGDVAFARIVAAMKPNPGRPSGKRLRFTRPPPTAHPTADARAKKHRPHPPGKS